MLAEIMKATEQVEEDEIFECVLPAARGLSHDERQFLAQWVDTQDPIRAARFVWGPTISGKRALAQILAKPAARLYVHDLRVNYYGRIFNTKEDIIVEIEQMLMQGCKGKLRVRLLELLAKILIPKVTTRLKLEGKVDEQGNVTMERGLTAEQISVFRHELLGMDRALATSRNTTIGASTTGRPHPIDITYTEKETKDEQE